MVHVHVCVCVCVCLCVHVCLWTDQRVLLVHMCACVYVYVQSVLANGNV
jgi:hypothetical protein